MRSGGVKSEELDPDWKGGSGGGGDSGRVGEEGVAFSIRAQVR